MEITADKWSPWMNKIKCNKGKTTA